MWIPFNIDSRFIPKSGSRWAIALVIGFLLPFIYNAPYFLHIITIFFLYVILSIGLSIVVGYAGLLDLGYVAFFAVGAYLYAVLNTTTGFPFWLAIPAAACLASLFGVVLGIPTLRVRGDYVALVTLAFGEMIRIVLLNWGSVTNGPKGISAVSSPSFGALRANIPFYYYFIALFALVVSILFVKRLSTSPIAKIWEAIRDEEIAARTCGINSVAWLLLALVIGACFAGIVGVLFASIQRFVSPESFVLDESILILSIVVLAGGKSLPRIFLAAAILYLFPELLRGLNQFRALAFGGVLVTFTLIEHRFLQASAVPREQTGQRHEDTESLPPIGSELLSTESATIEMNLEGVVKLFSGLSALNNISISRSLNRTILGLIGPNGAGKTTLFNCLSGLEDMNEGRIHLGDIVWTQGLKSYQIARAGVGRTFQIVRLFKSMNIFDNVLIASFTGDRIPMFSWLWRGRTFKAFLDRCTERTEAALSVVRVLEEMQGVPVSSIPIALQRKTEIARALALHPRLLLLDEVASGLNDSEKKELAEILRNIVNSLGISIILVEHDMKFVMDLSDDIIVLDAGIVLAEGKPEEISTNPDVIEAYLGSSEVNDAVRS